MTTAMRFAYVGFALLAVAIGTLASDGATTETQKVLIGHIPLIVTPNRAKQLNKDAPISNKPSPETTTAVPPASSTAAPTTVPPSTVAPTNGTNAPNATTTSSPTTVSPSSTTTSAITNSTANSTTPIPKTTPLNPTTSATPTSTKAPSSSVAPPEPVTHPQTTGMPVTTAVPPAKDRHFDGLSFVGGITLAVCIMAIGAFSWKFYRTCNEGNYRTL